MNVSELNPDTLSKLLKVSPELKEATRKKKTVTFTKEHCKKYAYKILDITGDLSSRDRDRVLNLALKINKI